MYGCKAYGWDWGVCGIWCRIRVSVQLNTYVIGWGTSLMTQLVKNLPAMWETWVRSLGWEDPLEKGKATIPVFWPREFHGLYSPWGATSWTRLSNFHFGEYMVEIDIIPMAYPMYTTY